MDRSVKESLISDTLRLAHIDPSVSLKVRLQEKKGSKQRLYGKADHPRSRAAVPQDGSPTSSTEGKQKPVKDFDAYEAVNKGKFERIYPPGDEKLQKLYNVLLAGSQESFQQSYDMKNKESIAKVREDRRLEELGRDEAERRREKAALDSKRKAAQERARLVAQLPREELEINRQKMNRLEMNRALKADLQAAGKGELYKAVVKPLSRLVLHNTPAFTPRVPPPDIQASQVPNYRSSTFQQLSTSGGLAIQGTSTSTTNFATQRYKTPFSSFLSKSQVKLVPAGFVDKIDDVSLLAVSHILNASPCPGRTGYQTVQGDLSSFSNFNSRAISLQLEGLRHYPSLRIKYCLTCWTNAD